MIQAGNRAGFALKPFAQFRLVGQMLGQDFAGNDAVQSGLGTLVHFAHSTRTDPGENFIGPQGCGGLDRYNSPANRGRQSMTLPSRH
jgi:hypothetical protein